MKRIRRMASYFTGQEIALWCITLMLITVSFLAFDRENVMVYAASLIGVTSLILNAKGNPVGQMMMIVFSLLYGVISYRSAYYGEMFTYLGMTMPMAAFALVSWMKHPFQGNRAEVAVNRISRREAAAMFLLAAGVTGAFFFILAALNTAHLALSTLSVTTSFIAVYLTFRRSAYFALAYAANDVVLIVLWMLAARESMTYLSVIVCFVMFLLNDLYGYISWRRMEIRQNTVQAD